MPVLACPHCHTPLILPDDCGGRVTKCPSCGDDFTIPGTSGRQSATPVAAVLAPVEGRVTLDDLKRAESVRNRLTAENVGLQVELSRRLKRRERLAGRIAWLRRFQAGRAMLDRSMGRVGGFFLTITLGAALAVMFFSLFGLSAFGYFVVICLGLIASAVAYVPFSFYPDDVKLALMIPPLEEKLVEAGKLHDHLAAEEAVHRPKLDDAEAEYQRVKAAIDSRLHWLRTCQWQQMNSKNFANFLKQVLEEQGYQVEPTGKKGQVGIDLVAVRDKTRIAVQAKGVQSGPVDPQVVQQTHAGMGYFQCHACAVITNQQFLPSARQLADTLGCKTIDGSQIPGLIEGTVLV